MYKNSKVTRHENHKTYTTIKETNNIMVFVKNKSDGKVKRILVPKISSVRLGQTRSRKYNFREISKAKKVTSLPLFNSNNNKYMFVKDSLRINKSYDKILAQNSLKDRFNTKVKRIKYIRSRHKSHYNSLFYTNYKMYRCQISTNQETCCCSCNSDAMFEVMKSLYDCYKKKNCNNCNCILCGHLPREERRLAEKGKSEISLKKKTSTKIDFKSLQGMDNQEKERVLKEFAKQGKSLPIGKTDSQKEILEHVRKSVGLPPGPKSTSDKKKYDEAVAAGIIRPLEGMSSSEKEKSLRQLASIGLPLPEGRTSSEKAIVEKIQAVAPPLSDTIVPSKKLKKAKEAGLLTPIKGKTRDEKEKILTGLAKHGIPLPEVKTPSEKKIVEKITADLGLPPPPTSTAEREKYQKAYAAGLITPLEGKTVAQKEKILSDQAALGLKLPEGRTTSEKDLISKVKKSVKPTKEDKFPSKVLLEPFSIPSGRIKKAKEAGFLTPLKGKTKAQREKILKGLALQGIPLPEGKTSSENELINSVRTSLGLPPEPKDAASQRKYKEAIVAGIITPLEGKTAKQKEKILREQAALGLPLPEGRTSSEKAIVAKVKAVAPPISDIPAPSKRLKEAKEAGLLTPIKGKTRDEKEKILTGLAKHGIPLPEVKTPSEKKIVEKITADLGLPPPPASTAEKEKYKKAYVAGLITPLEGKTVAQKEKILSDQAALGLKLPEGRTASEKDLISKVKKSVKPTKEDKFPSKVLLEPFSIPSGRIKKAKEAGFLTPLKGKTKAQREKILKGLALQGIPLPEGKTSSENELINSVRTSLGLPPEPKNAASQRKYKEAIVAGIITPLEGKTAKQKEKILREQAALGLPLPEGRTSSEKAIVAKVKAVAPPISDIPAPSKRLKRAKEAGLLTPIKGKTRDQKEKILTGLAKHGIPLPEVKTPSEKKIVEKITADLGLPPPPTSTAEKEKYKKAYVAGLITPLEGKTVEQKEKILSDQAALGLKLPEGRTTSEKDLISKVKKSVKPTKEDKLPSKVLLEPFSIPSGKIKKAKEAGFLTPLKGKTKSQREKILKGLALQGIPLPEGKTSSENELINSVRTSLGLPPEPKNAASQRKYKEAIVAGIITPLEGKTAKQKEKILREQAALGLPLPEGRTSSEKAIVAKVKAVAPPISDIPAPSKRLKRAKEAGLLTPLKGKTRDEKEKILTGLAKHGIPLPEVKTPSEKKIVEKITADLGLPPPPTSTAEKEKYKKAYVAGLITPLEGKTDAQKEKILSDQAALGLKLPEGRTTSEKDLISKVKESVKPTEEDKFPSKVLLEPFSIPSGKIKKAKEAGFLTPLKGKTKAQREKILKGLALQGIPLPEGKTSSESELINSVRTSLGLPPEPKDAASQRKYKEAIVAGIITPLEGKTKKQKEKILREQAALGLPLPEGRTSSEKAIVAKVKAVAPPISDIPAPSKRLKRAKEAGLLTPIKGKTRDQKEKILTGLAKHGIPLPEVKTPSEKKIVEKITADLGLPPPPTSTAEKEKYKKAYAAGLITPLEGKTVEQKEKILSDQAAMGLKLPEGRTTSEKDMIANVKKSVKPTKEDKLPSKVLLEPFSIPSGKIKKAKEAGFLTPLKGKTKAQREKILKGLALQGIPLPEGKTSSENEIINSVRTSLGLPPEPKNAASQRKYKEAIVAGIITPLEGKTAKQKEKILREQAALGLPLPEGRTSSEKAIVAKVKAVAPPISDIPAPSKRLKRAKEAGLLTPIKGKTRDQKEKILTGLAKHGIPLPEVKTPSEKKIVEKITADLGLPPPPTSTVEKEKYQKAYAAGLITPLEGKTVAQKEKILSGQAAMGLKLPEGRTTSEKDMIDNIKKSVKPTKEDKLPSKVLLEPFSIPSGKIKKAKEAGFLTPLKGKTKTQKEKILKGLALQGIPLPEGKTSSENELINSVRTSLGLPPEPQNAASQRKYKEAIVAGIITPLEGKTAKQKEKILREQAALGLPLPEGRTSSEKAIVAKVKAVAPPISDIPAPSKRLKRAKEAGLLTPIKGKTRDEKEKILTGLAKHGIPLPEVKTPSEKKIVEKITADLGLPPPPTSTAEKEKYKKAYVAGLITPLEGKTDAQKEKILSDQAALGLKLPEGRTTSEKDLISKVKKSVKPTKEDKLPSKVLLEPFSIPSGKIKKAKEAGFLTPLKGKTKAQREKILKGLALQGIPLPEGKTSSENELINSVRTSLGLPPEPKNAASQRKYKEAIVAGIITPLEGKTAKQKEKILREQAALGLPLPEGRTSSEKAIVAKVKAVAPPISDIPAPSKRLKKAKEAGLLTPIKGKTRDEKEKILTGLAKHGIPLPEVKTPSEKKIVEKITADLGLPPPPTSTAAKERYQKAYAAGLITPLEGKSTSQKEKILQNQADMGLNLPVGRTPSEKSVIAKIKKKKKLKSAEILESLKGKPSEEKIKTLKEIALKGFPLPEGKTTSEKKIIDKIVKEIGLPPKPKKSSEKEKFDDALAKGVITPLEGKTAAQKEKILRDQAAMGLKLPEGRTTSEKNLIAKVQASALKTPKVQDIEQLDKKSAKKMKEGKGPSDECICNLFMPPAETLREESFAPVRVSSEKIKKAKEAGFLTPLKGKTKAQREKILKGLALQGIPLPEGKTSSESELINSVRTSLGLPPEPKNAASQRKYKEAVVAGIITPLEGKTAKQKEKILREQAALGLPLPEGRTSSEKAIVAKVKAIAPPISDIPAPAKRLKRAKEAGLLTPIKGKTREEKEKILTGLAKYGIPLPEVKTPSEKKIVEKITADLGLPPPPTTPAAKEKYQKAYAAGLITPLEGKSPSEKEKILQKQANMGLSLPVGRTPSEKAVIENIQEKTKALLTPLIGKTKEEKEKILKGLAMNGIILPEAKSPSEKNIIEKVRADIGLPPEPKMDSEKKLYKQYIANGDIAPLEGKSPAQKEKILQNVAKLGLQLPTGRTSSEKALIAKVKATSPKVSEIRVPSETLKKAKAAGLLTPLKGKKKAQKEKILKALAMQGIPLPEAKSPSESKIIEKVRAEIGLPPEPETPAEKKKYKKAIISGQIAPLEGQTAPQKEKNLRKQAELGLRLPEGRTKSEKALVDKIKLSAPQVSEIRIPSETLKKAKAAGLLTPLEGKKKEQKEKILKGLAMQGIPLPEAKSPSESKIIEKVRAEIGLPPEPETPAEKKKYKKAIISGQIAPLEGQTAPQKEKNLRKQAELGLRLPEGRTKSEKALVNKIKLTAPQVSEIRIPSETLKKAKAAGLLTPLEGKKKEQKEKILKGLAMQGIPLPEAKSPSESKIIEKVRAEIGLPPEPETPAEKKKYKQAIISGQIAPLEGQTAPQKEKNLIKQAELGLRLPEGRTKSEKALVDKIKLSAPQVSEIRIPPETLKKAKAAGLLTPLEGKKKEQKEKILKGLAMHGIPLPEAKSPSESKIIEKVRAEIGLPPEPETPAEKKKYKKAIISGQIAPLEGQTAPQKEKNLRKQAELGLRLPEGRTKSEKALVDKIKLSAPQISEIRIPSETLKKAKAAGLLTPLEGKKKEQKEKILKGLAMQGIPLPEAKTPSESKIIEKVRAEIGLPPEPETPAEKKKYKQAIISGQIAPLEGQTAPQKEKNLRKQAELGLRLPEGRTKSEKALVDKVKLSVPQISEIRIPPEKLKKAKAAGLLTPLEGKKKEQKEKILKGLAMQGIPLPEAKSPSESKIIEKVRAEIGLPPEPETPAEKKKYKQAIISGQIAPLEGQTAPQKEKNLKKQAELGLRLPEGRTKSEKALVDKIKLSAPQISEIRIPSETLKKAKAAGLLTPLEGKKKEQKEKILKGLAMQGIPLPEAKTPSESKIIEKVRAEIGLPPEPETPAEKKKYKQAIISGQIAPLEGQTAPQKEKNLRKQAELGLRLPEGRTKSEKALVDKVKLSVPQVSEIRIPPEKLKKAKAAGLLTPLEGKKKEQKEKILKGLAMQGIPLPEAKSPSESKIIEKVRAEIGLPPEPETPAEKKKYKQAIISGQIAPLEGQTAPQKEKNLRKQAELGLRLPEGRTKSEKALVDKVKLSVPQVSEIRIPPEKLKKAKAAGLLTPLEGKKKEQKEKILKGLAMQGIPLPEAKSPSESKIIEKVRAEIGLPPEPETPAEKKKYKQAIISGQIAPLEGQTAPQKEKNLRKQAELGLRLPEGRTKSEKALVDKVKLSVPQVSEIRIPPEKLKKAKAAGLLTPLEGKKKEQKEKILKGLAMQGIPLPEAKTPSESKIIEKVRAEIGLPPEPETPAEKKKYKQAIISGQIAPLEGQTAPQKEKNLRKQAELGLSLPEGRTKSEKALVDKVKLSVPQVSEIRIPPEKLKKAKAAGLLTPLEGKKKEQKEKILKGLAMQGIPLPEAKSPSESKIIEKVRAEIGLPPEPETPAEKKKYKQAIISGQIAPLEGQTAPQKEKNLRKQAELGLRLPEGRTKSEKALVDKVKLSAPQVSEIRIPSEILKKAKAAGLLTPLEGKKKEQKEKILKGLAMQGIPLPEAKSPSESKIIEKVRAEIGLPPEPETPAEKKKYKKAIISGQIAPLEGQTAPQKEKNLRKQAALGLLLPKGRTPSEIAMIKKIQTSVGIPPKKRTKLTTTDVFSKSKAGIVESIQEITKVTKCDKSCGCDKKKIKFKHSYVKIRITSPDISSFCPCPDECLPGVKGGAFTDSEGIKVMVGRATEITKFSSKEQAGKRVERSLMTFNAINSTYNENNIVESHFTRSEDDLIRSRTKHYELDPIFIKSFSTIRLHDNAHKNFTYFGKVNSKSTDMIIESFNLLKSTSSSSFSSRNYENESTLSFITPKTISNLSLTMTNMSYESNHNFNDIIHECIIETRYDNLLCINSNDSVSVISDIYLSNSKSSVTTISAQCSESLCLRKLNHDIYALGTTQSDFQEKQWNSSCDLTCKSSIQQDTENNEVKRLVNEIIAKELFTRSSSFIILIPTSSEDISDDSINSLHSSICIQVSQSSTFRCPVTDKLYTDNEFSEEYLSTHPCAISIRKYPKMENRYQTGRYEENKSRIISMDTTQDRPCCCRMPFTNNGAASNNSPCDINSTRRNVNTSFPKISLNDTCKCISDNKNNMVKQMKGTACGPSNENFLKRANIIKTLDKACSCKRFGKSLKSTDACPCQEDFLENSEIPTKNKKKVICECPMELPEVEEEYNEEEKIKDIRKFHSELTQLTSGFKIGVSPKMKSEFSFEDVLKYYAQQAENDEKSHSSKQRSICECPAPDVTLGGMGGIGANKFKGIKLHMDGKGSGSKALQGILCFHQYCTD